MVIDMTAELSWIITALNGLLLLAAAGVAFSIERSADRSLSTQHDRTYDMAIVGTSPSVPAYAGAAPSDTSVSEAA